MKKLFWLSMLIMSVSVVACFWACTKSEARGNTGMAQLTGNVPFSVAVSRGIPVEMANRMIGSYLHGIDYTVNTNETRSFLCNADTLRLFLKDRGVKQLKFMLAHNMEYIDSGYEGRRPRPDQNALTFVITGVDSGNNYILTNEEKAINDLEPCPADCVQYGSAANDLIQLK